MRHVAAMASITAFLVACVDLQKQAPLIRGANDLTPGSEADRVSQSPACRVEGTFRTQVFETRTDPPGCGGAHRETSDEGDKVTVTVQRGRAALSLSGTTGLCEGGWLHGCTLASRCDIDGPEGTVTLQIQWTFGPDGFEGTEDITTNPAHRNHCRLTETIRGLPQDPSSPEATEG
jgi:hypothetical protein